MTKIPLALLVVALAANSVHAAPLVQVKFSVEDGYGFIGLDGLEFGVEARDLYCSSAVESAVARCNQLPPVQITDFYSMKSGPLVDVVAADDPFQPLTIYTFEAGSIELDFNWVDTDGTTKTGSFTAPVFSFSNESGSFLQSVVTECQICGRDPGIHTHDAFLLGPGLFDAEIAERLGVERHTLGGNFIVFLEAMEGDATFGMRWGNINFPQLQISAVAVPEPGIGVLVLGGLAGVLLRRRSHRICQ